MNISDSVKYDNIMRELQQTWGENELLLSKNADEVRGIRSSQVAALVALLVEHGVFDKKE